MSETFLKPLNYAFMVAKVFEIGNNILKQILGINVFSFVSTFIARVLKCWYGPVILENFKTSFDSEQH